MADDTEGSEGATSDETETGTEEGGQPAELGEAGKKALKAERDRASAAERKAKDLEARLGELERSQMTETERAISEAKEAGKAEGKAEAAGEIAQAQFRAAAAGRLDDDQLEALTAALDITPFLTDDGKVDPVKIRTFVDKIAPAEGGVTTDFGQGARGGRTGSSDPLLTTLQGFIH